MNVSQLKAAAHGRWPEILSALAGIDVGTLDGKHHPCPKCGGVDRFRLINENAGAVLCNQCFNTGNGDGIAAVQWATGCDFKTACEKIADYLKLPARDAATGPPQIVAEYDYFDESAELLFQVCRREPGKNGKAKDFCQRRPDGKGGWIYNLNGVRRVLYHLPEVLAADPAQPVFIVEGEKDADNLAAIGLIATTNPGGCAPGNWHEEFGETLRGRHVVIIPDNDDVGREHAKRVGESVADYSASYRLLKLPGLPPKGDVSDWLAVGGTRDELLRLAGEATPLDKSDCRPRSMAERLREHKGLRQPVVHGLLRQGETMNVIAPSKTGKSWLVYSLALSIVTGKRWLDTFLPVPGKVLLVDNELHDETLADRIPKVADALGILRDEYGEQFDVLTLRGQLKDIQELGREFESYPPGKYTCIIIDSLYRAMPKDTDENSNQHFTGIYNLIDSHAMRMGAAIVLIHHTSKGNQSDKSVTDVGSGAGAISRAADSHVVLREHQEPGVAVMDAALRSWPGIDPICLRWSFPLWQPDHSIDPAALKGTRKPKRAEDPNAPKGQPWNAERFAGRFINDSPAPRAAIIDDAVEAGLSNKRADKLFDAAVAKGFAHPWKCPDDKRRLLYANVIQPEAPASLAV
jgi:AAA domain-containing protein/primase-helicase-like zinc-binding protein